jgi:acetolactate synthase I/II/III large subunit
VASRETLKYRQVVAPVRLRKGGLLEYDDGCRMTSTTVAEIVVDGLKRAGTPRMFTAGSPRTARSFLDAARRRGLPVTTAARETGACVMAGVTADLVDAPGAVLVAGDVGVSARALSMVEGAPLIFLTSGHSSALSGVKETLRVEAASAAHRIAHAARLAMTEPRGPVHLDVAAVLASTPAVPLATSCRPDPPPYPDGEILDRAAGILSGASRALLIVGRLCRSPGATQWLRAFVEALPAPLLTTAGAKGVLPDPHPLMLGALGVTGVDERLLSRADLVVVVGLDTREAEALPEACWSSAPVLVFGPAALPDGRMPAAHVVGEVSAIIEELAVRLRDKPRADWDVAEVDRLRREGAARGAGDGLVARVARIAREATPAGTIATMDAGAYQRAVATAWHATAPREFFASSVPAAGYALPAAIAAHLVHPDRSVVCFSGPNELAADASELETAARLAARILVVVYEVDGTDAAPLAQRAESAGMSVFSVDSEASFSRACGAALSAERGSLIAVRS